MSADLDRLTAVLDEAGLDLESLTLVLAAGVTAVELAAALGLGQAEGDATAYGVADCPGGAGGADGALAVEQTGYGDPSLPTLRGLGRDGRTVAVARSNLQAHVRFGLARDGEIAFDSDEYAYVDSLDEFPTELRDLAALAWDDASADVDPFVVALAMAERVTGLTLTAADLQRLLAGEWRAAPSLVYDPDA